MRDIFPTLKPGKYGQASTVAPSADKLKMDETAGDKWKRVSSWIHPHSHGCTREHFKKGEGEIRSSTASLSEEMEKKDDSGCCLSKWKIKKGLRKNIDRNNKSRKVVNETVGIGELKVSVIHCIYASRAPFKYLASHRNTTNTNNYDGWLVVQASNLQKRKWLG